MSASIKQLLRDLGIKPSKAKGQHFLTDPGALASIIEFARPVPDERAVEIGGGLGALTRELVACPFSKLVVIELEEEFCRRLRADYPAVRVINADVLTVDFSELGQELVVFGNLPYSHSTDIIFHLIGQATSIKRAILMLQKEFAARLGASPGGREYGVISVMCQLWSEVYLGPTVPGTSFYPEAEVDSQVFELVFQPAPRFPVSDPYWFRRIVMAAFSERRRKVFNSLKQSRLATPEVFRRALDEVGIDAGRRAETISVEEYARLANGVAALNAER
jgi:16S rRNA (adenine1518-N6/adenine1519-N6)-dimethyltransferase